MNPYQTFMGLARAQQTTRLELGRVDQIMHEINSKIMASPVKPALKERWHSIYKLWVPYHQSNPLVVDDNARLSRADLVSMAERVADLHKAAITTYGQWKNEISALRGARPSNPNSNTVAPKNNAGKGVLKGALIFASLLGGAAAIQSMMDGRKRRSLEEEHRKLEEANLNPGTNPKMVSALVRAVPAVYPVHKLSHPTTWTEVED